MARDPKFSPAQEAASHWNKSSGLHRKMTEGTGPADSWGVRGTQRPRTRRERHFLGRRSVFPVGRTRSGFKPLLPCTKFWKWGQVQHLKAARKPPQSWEEQPSAPAAFSSDAETAGSSPGAPLTSCATQQVRHLSEPHLLLKRRYTSHPGLLRRITSTEQLRHRVGHTAGGTRQVINTCHVPAWLAPSLPSEPSRLLP